MKPKFNYGDIVEVSKSPYGLIGIGEVVEQKTHEEKTFTSFSYGVKLGWEYWYLAEEALKIICRAEDRQDRKGNDDVQD